MNSLTTPTTPRTLLDAVNELLAIVRVGSINTLDATGLNRDASDAKHALDAASISLQEQGWRFNTEENMVLEPEAGTNFVFLPRNCLRVVVSKTSTGDRLVERGGKLYNPRTHSYAIPEGAIVDCVVGLEFSELPSIARSYVTAVAARAFGIPKLPTGATFRYTEDFVQKALVEMERLESDISGNTLAESSPHFKRMRRR